MSDTRDFSTSTRRRQALVSHDLPIAHFVPANHHPDYSRLCEDVGRGHVAYRIIDQGDRPTEMIAVQVPRNIQPRATIIGSLAPAPINGILNPIAYGHFHAPASPPFGYIVCQAPPGPSLETLIAGGQRLANDLEIIETVIRPAAHALDALAQRGFTHRAIRPDNIFAPTRGAPITLGCAWATIPGALQPAAYEPPYMAQCTPCGRGDGVIADDIYALGVSVLALCLGMAPLATLTDDAITQRKLLVGSYSALVEEARLPSALSDLLRSMLAEDPEHRPSPVLLTDPGTARARRVAARPPRKAQRPIRIGTIDAWNARSLAYGLMMYPEPGIQALKKGIIDKWLRRMLGEPALGQRLDAAISTVHSEAPGSLAEDAVLLVQAIAALDPLAPLCWRELTFWPDALGAWIASQFNDPDFREKIEELINKDATAVWSDVRADRCDPSALRADARQMRSWLHTRGMTGHLTRVLYGLNATLPCQSPLLDLYVVTRIEELLPALDARGRVLNGKEGPPIDAHIACFIAARSGHRWDGEMAAISACEDRKRPYFLLNFYSKLQDFFCNSYLPNLARWHADQSKGVSERWYNDATRKKILANLDSVIKTGSLKQLIALIDNRKELGCDYANAAIAANMIIKINRDILDMDALLEDRIESASTISREIIFIIGLTSAISSLIMIFFL